MYLQDKYEVADVMIFAWRELWFHLLWKQAGQRTWWGVWSDSSSCTASVWMWHTSFLFADRLCARSPVCNIKKSTQLICSRERISSSLFCYNPLSPVLAWRTCPCIAVVFVSYRLCYRDILPPHAVNYTEEKVDLCIFTSLLLYWSPSVLLQILWTACTLLFREMRGWT